MPKQKVLFKFGTSAQYAALDTKLDNALYFLLDTNQLFRGENPIAQSHIYTGTRTDEQTDAQALNVAVSTNLPVPNDIAIITDTNGDSRAFIRGTNNNWILLAKSVDVSSQITNLTDRVIALESSVNSLTGVFHFKGSKDTVAELNEISNPAEGDVYQVGSSEYAYNGTTWVELGSNVDLSNYATISQVSDLEALIGQPAHTETNSETGLSEDIPASGIYSDLFNRADELIPIFDGLTAGLVPVATGNLSVSEKSNLFLNANGIWTQILSGGGQSSYTAPDGTTFNTAEAYVEYMTSHYSEFYWDSLDE